MRLYRVVRDICTCAFKWVFTIYLILYLADNLSLRNRLILKKVVFVLVYFKPVIDSKYADIKSSQIFPWK